MNEKVQILAWGAKVPNAVSAREGTI